MRVIIYGMGATGLALKDWLSTDNTLYLYDDNPNKSCVTIQDIPFAHIDLCIVSPGITRDGVFIDILKEYDITVISELEFCYLNCNLPIISVTGTNGKTTMTQMIHHVLQYCNKPSKLLGNGGVPFARGMPTLVDQDIVVLESSSFQLDRCVCFAPYISVFANMDIDHIDYHRTLQNYIEAKCNNFIYQSKGQYAVFNADDAKVDELSQQCQCYALYYSLAQQSNCYINGETIKLEYQGVVETSKLGEVKSFAEYNQSNALGAILTCHIMGCSLKMSVEALNTYQVDQHKNQLVATIGNVRFVDDSKATNVHATIASLRVNYGNIALILGGFDKGYEFDNLMLYCGSVRLVVAIGNTSPKIVQSCKIHGIECIICDSMQDAVSCCYNAVKLSGGTVLLSPACSSFDMYDNYRHRGEHFVRCISELCLC